MLGRGRSCCAEFVQPKSGTIRNFPSLRFATPLARQRFHLPRSYHLPPSHAYSLPSPSLFNMATGPPGSMSLTSSNSQPSSDPSWEGDKMQVFFISTTIASTSPTLLRFNIYIYDYCNKRGFRKTAHELLAEAEIPPDSTPPINAKQGLLFEYVSSFPLLLISSHLSGGGAYFGSFSPLKVIAKGRRMP